MINKNTSIEASEPIQTNLKNQGFVISNGLSTIRFNEFKAALAPKIKKPHVDPARLIRSPLVCKSRLLIAYIIPKL